MCACTVYIKSVTKFASEADASSLLHSTLLKCNLSYQSKKNECNFIQLSCKCAASSIQYL